MSYTAYTSVRERVNAVLALQIMGFALLLAGGFYVLSRRARLQTVRLARESAELRRLNGRLPRALAARQRVRRAPLEAPHPRLAPSPKLAALGENVGRREPRTEPAPSPAMKTYLAGAQLLFAAPPGGGGGGRGAASSFQRIDDLIDRMGAITRQLKCLCKKGGGEAFEPVDLRDALKGAMTMMEPQLRTTRVEITQNLPRRPGDGDGRPGCGSSR